MLGNVSPVLMILLARAFPPEVFGVYVSLQLLVLTISRAVTLGLDRGLAWFIASNAGAPEKAARALVAASRLSILLSSLVICIVGAPLVLGSELGRLASVWLGAESTGLGFAFACLLSLPCWSLLHLLAGALEGVRKPGYRIYWNHGAVAALGPALALFGKLIGLGVWALPFGLLVANLTGVVGLLWVAARHFPIVASLRSGWPARALVQYSWPIGLSDAVWGLRARADLWLLLVLGGAEAAGVYAVMSTLAGGVRTIRQTYDPMVVSVVSGLSVKDTGRLRPVFGYAVHMVSSLQLMVATVIAFFPRELLSLAGRAYVLEPSALALVIAGHLVQGAVGITAAVVLGLGRSRALLVLNVGLLGLAALLARSWIPLWGLWGAALAGLMVAIASSAGSLGLQLRLTRSWLFGSRLIPNAVLVAGLLTLVLARSSDLLALSLLERLGWAAAVAMLVGANVAWRHAGSTEAAVLTREGPAA